MEKVEQTKDDIISYKDDVGNRSCANKNPVTYSLLVLFIQVSGWGSLVVSFQAKEGDREKKRIHNALERWR